MSKLEIKNLFAGTKEKEILRGVNLTVRSGEVHALMGPNGSGKSTLAETVLGNPQYQIRRGQILFDDQELNDFSPDKRAGLGLFLAFQYPVEVEGVGFSHFLRLAFNSHREQAKQLGVSEFQKLLRENAGLLGIEEGFLERNLNDGLSGGEKKKAEILQLAVLEPKMAILDETDSGLDIDALKVVARGIRDVFERCRDNLGLLLVTHHPRILRYIEPDVVHVMVQGKIIESGKSELAERLEKEGYGSYRS